MGPSADVRSIYDRTALEYDRCVTPCRACQFLILAHELGLKGGENVLEVGSGPGFLSTHLARLLREGQVTGVDLSERMVELASDKARAMGLANVRFELGNALNLRFPDEMFEAVVSSYLVPWVPDVGRYFAEIHRVLKEGGKLGIIAPSPEAYNDFGEAYRVVMGRHRAHTLDLSILSGDELLEALDSAGFRIQRDFQMNFKERLSPEVYVRRINAITDERYLETVPLNERDAVRGELMQELADRCRKDVLTTECSIFVIATRTEAGGPTEIRH